MRPYVRMLAYLKPYTRFILLSFVFTFLFALANVMCMPLIRDISNEVAGKNLKYFNNQIFNALVLFGIRIAVKYGHYYLMAYVSGLVLMDVRMALFRKLQDLPISFFSRWKTGEIMGRIFSDVDRLRDFLLQSFEQFFPQTLTLIGVIGYLFFINWRLTLVSVFGVPLFMYVTIYFGEKLKKAASRQQRKAADMTHVVSENISHVSVVKAFGLEKQQTAKFHRESKRNLSAMMQGIKFTAMLEPLIQMLQFIVILLVVWFGGYEVANGHLSGPVLISFFTGILLLIDPIVALSRVWANFQQFMASVERVFEILDQPVLIQNLPEAIMANRFLGEIQFDSVSFAYEPNSKMVLENASFIINPGEIVAVIGVSGSGKTTLVNLIPRFYDPTLGVVRLDGQDIRQLDIDSLRSQIAIVPQESLLFRGTLIENLRQGRAKATEEEVKEACLKANAWEFIEKMPGKLRARIGDRGYRLSGGQKQRIAIARAILKDPRILILDEATSALDSKSEQEVQAGLNKLMSNRTTVVIAHRLSTIQNAHKIMVMENGMIKEMGTHEALLAKGVLYRSLYDMQFKPKK